MVVGKSRSEKISLDFCLAHAFIFSGVRESLKIDFFSAMKKKNEQNNRGKCFSKKLIYYKEIASIVPLSQ